MFTITFPVDTGTFVKTPDGSIGTIACYQSVDETDGKDDYAVIVSGHKSAWCGEYLLSELEILDSVDIL